MNGPGIDMGVEDLRSLYSQTFSVNHTYLNEGHGTNCYEVAIYADELLSEWFYMKRQSADLYGFIAATCAEQLNINRLAAEWNILTMTGYGTDQIIRNKAIAPTWITTSPSSRLMYRTLFANIFTRFNWSSIYVVIDTGNYSSYPYYATLFDEQLMGELRNMQLTLRRIDTRRSVDYLGILHEFQKTSRILVFMGQGQFFRKLLLIAESLLMTNGEYVYIGFKMFKFDGFGLMDWRYGDADDGRAREAFRSALLVSVAPSAQVVPERLAATWRERTQRRFNVTVDNANTSVPWPTVTSTYAAFLMFGQVLNETLANDPAFDFQDGARFARLFWNRTFHFPFSEVRLDEKGERIPPMIIEDLDPETGQLQVVLYQDNMLYNLNNVSGAHIDWGGPAGSGNAVPRNEPRCGYQGYRCTVSVSSVLPAVLAVAFTSITFVGVLIYVKRYLYVVLDARWWLLSEQRLQIPVPLQSPPQALSEPDITDSLNAWHWQPHNQVTHEADNSVPVAEQSNSGPPPHPVLSEKIQINITD
ncbi:hypothetical protein BV898_11631 [Hypsibius exemplaris]|uniref:Receptor ligand binding region domain-containing protein n=1 Tax=Hypsibius exemplaris TaxID=2072580 RepID=A0A1W0WG41_HYPEX|nr:hypothetical protein BV898_11631 [Hypsibius exemplaris]